MLVFVFAHKFHKECNTIVHIITQNAFLLIRSELSGVEEYFRAI